MKVSIVIINFNSTEHTINCIKSIKAKTKTETEIIVVDNNSEYDDRIKIENWINSNPNSATYISSKKNTGFSMGNMLGANVASGNYIFLLNNDCLLINDAIDELVKFMEEHPNVGLAGPKTYDGNNNYMPSFDYIPTVANKWLGHSLCRLFKKNSYPSRKKEYQKPLSVPMISGSAMFFRKDCFNNLGGLDTNLFLYCEEEDISIRAKNKSYDIFHVPTAEIIHYCGVSTERSIDIEKEFYISLFYVLDKHYGFLSRNLIKLKYILKELKKGIKNKKNMKVFLFLICGPSLCKSMRHKITIRQ